MDLGVDKVLFLVFQSITQNIKFQMRVVLLSPKT